MAYRIWCTPVCVDVGAIGDLPINRDRIVARTVERQQEWYHCGEDGEDASHHRSQPLLVERQPIHVKPKATSATKVRARRKIASKHAVDSLVARGSPLAFVQGVEVILQQDQFCILPYSVCYGHIATHYGGPWCSPIPFWCTIWLSYSTLRSNDVPILSLLVDLNL